MEYECRMEERIIEVEDSLLFSPRYARGYLAWESHRAQPFFSNDAPMLYNGEEEAEADAGLCLDCGCCASAGIGACRPSLSSGRKKPGCWRKEDRPCTVEII
ncbi:hypothetical protein N0M98_26940 [Paenibacillus doosanensis]|uniref:Uncharacterized protein n=1 Tax=Paenibacillus konkukensis TaxID=2020716 RepID=A0ABY4RUC0_9BACL|nr:MULTISPECIES: hypothetical protein [Paenibacillus]MCS7463745.1 hypothetical protein [Paenibacillus doosanensis]UQZ85241.1 hypothetical protein SK3146_04530 [Paenibacillus konkukensis]